MFNDQCYIFFHTRVEIYTGPAVQTRKSLQSLVSNVAWTTASYSWIPAVDSGGLKPSQDKD